jgi:hypothetical protein
VNWINVSDKLPEQRTIVLAFRRGWTMPTTLKFVTCSTGSKWYLDKFNRYLDKAPDVWMPMPKPPKELLTSVE